MKLKDDKQKMIDNIERNGYYYYEKFLNGLIIVADKKMGNMMQFKLNPGNINTLKNSYKYNKDFKCLFVKLPF